MCDEFTFAVAFVTSSGVMCLHNAFKELEEKNVLILLYLITLTLLNLKD